MTIRNTPAGDTEKYRYCLGAKTPPDCASGACTLLVRRIDNRVELLHHAALHTGAALTDEQARDVASALLAAADAP